MRSGANEQDVTGKVTEKGTRSYLMKDLLASAVLQMKAEAQWEVTGYSVRGRDLHLTLML